MLIKNISVLGDDLFVICEEYGNFEDSGRRIDLLCIDKDRKLVVVEIKRTEDGGHAELQAIRYAAMISSMNLDEVIAARAEMMKKSGASVVAHEELIGAARQEVYEFCGVIEGEEFDLSEDLRILLVSSQFSTEITTTVLWLNRQGLDISCIRLIPYQHLDNSIFIDATKIIPLPETEQYEIKIRSREIEARNKAKEKNHGCFSLWSLFIEKSNYLNGLFEGRLPNVSDYIQLRLIRI